VLDGVILSVSNLFLIIDLPEALTGMLIIERIKEMPLPVNGNKGGGVELSTGEKRGAVLSDCAVLGMLWHPACSRQPPVIASSGMRLQMPSE
jgi:hypothetical protein